MFVAMVAVATLLACARARQFENVVAARIVGDCSHRADEVSTVSFCLSMSERAPPTDANETRGVLF
jgi:hypothetical protein